MLDEVLAAVFPDDGPGWPKAEVLYRLAQAADGPIVEVGCSRGIGTVALALGAQAGNGGPVFAIDPFLPVRGWAGEPYGPDLKAVWFENVRAAGVLERVQSVMLPVQELDWPHPAALTFWDLGMSLAGPVGPWLAGWCRDAVLPGGLVAINETGDDNLHVDEWLESRPWLKRVGVEYYMRLVRRHG